MDPSLPSILMPLVSSYLSYEETCRCMQLNSNFHQYIDQNWLHITKKEISIDLNISEYATKGHVEVSVNRKNLKIIIFHNSMAFESKTLLPCLQAFIDKEMRTRRVFMEPRNEDIPIDSTIDGLNLVLNGLILRFAIRNLDMNCHNMERDSEIVKAVQNCFRNYYRTTSKHFAVNCIQSHLQVSYFNMAESLMANEVTVCLYDGCWERRYLNFQNLPSTSWKADDMYSLINDWTSDLLHFNSMRMLYHDPRSTSQFDVLCDMLGVTVEQEYDSDKYATVVDFARPTEGFPFPFDFDESITLANYLLWFDIAFNERVLRVVLIWNNE